MSAKSSKRRRKLRRTAVVPGGIGENLAKLLR